MKLFFLIICHKISPSLIYNLKKLSTFKNSEVLVHIDKKSTFDAKELFQSENITYVKERINIRWGSISQVQATYKLFLELQDKNFDYVSLMSGEDLFIKSEEEFISFLHLHSNKEFIGVQKNIHEFYDPTERFAYKYPSLFFTSQPSVITKIFQSLFTLLFKRGFLQNKKTSPYKKFYKGSNWFTLSNRAVRLIIKEIDEKNLLDYFKNSFCIDEVIFQTILINNGWLNAIYLIDNPNVTDNQMSLRYVNWTDGPQYPKILNKHDLSQQFEHNIFFVRKISATLNEDELASLCKR